MHSMGNQLELSQAIKSAKKPSWLAQPAQEFKIHCLNIKLRTQLWKVTRQSFFSAGIRWAAVDIQKDTLICIVCFCLGIMCFFWPLQSHNI